MNESFRRTENVPFLERDLRPWIVTLTLACLAGFLTIGLLFIAATARPKITAAVVISVLGVAAAFASGNPRLFCLWGLLLTIPFDLAKRFGTIIAKLGGETAFRVELSDPFWIALLIFIGRDIWRGDRTGIRVPRVTFVWVAIMLLGLGAILFGPWSLTAAHEVVRMIKVMLLFLVVVNELTRPRRFLHCAAALIASSIIQASFGLTEYFMHRNFGLVSLGETSIETTRQLAQDSLQGESVFRVGAFMI